MKAPRVCSVEMCDKPIRARGLCRSHYDKNPELRAPLTHRFFCIVANCRGKHLAKGLCNKHYNSQPVQKAQQAAYDKHRRAVNKEYLRQQYLNNPRKCSVENCGKPHFGHNLCSTHYSQLPERVAKNRAYQQQSYGTKKAIIIKRTAQYYVANKAKIDSYRASYREINRAHIREWHREHFRANRSYYRAKGAKRWASELRRTPSWADLKAITEFYKACPPGYHVDHICPLQGKNVSGLHVIENLQYLPAKENLSKGNKFEIIQGLPGKAA